MRFIPFRARIAAAIGVLATGLACGGDKGPTEPPPVTARVQVSPGQVTLTALGQTRQFTATAMDATGKEIPGKTAVWSSAAPSVATVDAATGKVTAVSNGAAMITATVDNVAGTASLTVAQAVASVVVSPSSAALAALSATQQFRATAEDANNNAVAGVSFLWASSNGKVATVDASGLATAVASGTVTITATGATIPGTATLSVVQTATRLAFTGQPSSTPAGAALTPAVQVTMQDAAGITVPNATGVVTVALGANPTGATLVGTKTVTVVGGVATFTDLTISRAAGGYTLVATSGSLTSATSASFAIVPGPSAKLAFIVQPGTAEGTQAIAPAVQVAITDAFGNVVTGAADAVTVALGVNPGGATLSGHLTIVASNGIATFADLSVDVPGSGYTLVASDGALAPATSTSFKITLTFLMVSAGFYHTCGVTTVYATYCWGRNFWGELGDGTTSQRLSPWPVSNSRALGFTAVSAGYAHTCGVTAAGAVYCWGDNSTGAVGDKSTINRLVPTQVDMTNVPAGVTFVSANAGFHHSCGTTNTSDAYCWGANINGQLGDGSTTAQPLPTLVHGSVKFASASAGANHSCGMSTGGDAYCWGLNLYGQLGDGTGMNSSTPVLVSASGLTLPFTGVSTGFNHSCGVTAAPHRYAWCWGLNTSGELGYGNLINQASPVLVNGSVLFGFTAVSAGDHTCGVTSAGAIYCWGLNASGQVGDGSTTNQVNPVALNTLGVSLGIDAVSAGSTHSCGLTAAGLVYCWGSNAFGQLGDGTGMDRLTPVQVVQ